MCVEIICTYVPIQVYTYLLTPRCRVLLEQQTGLQLVKKFPAFHGTRRFITALTSVRHLSLSWASPIQSIYPHPTSCRSILTLSTHLRLGLPRGTNRMQYLLSTYLIINLCQQPAQTNARFISIAVNTDQYLLTMSSKPARNM